MLILAQAINEATKNGLSRQSLMKVLNSRKIFHGTYFRYEFENGENKHGKYYVYNINKNKIEYEISKDEIDTYIKENKL